MNVYVATILRLAAWHIHIIFVSVHVLKRLFRG